MKTSLVIIGMSLVSLNVSFASSLTSSENEQKNDTIEITSGENLVSSGNYVVELEQPNTFNDYGIDLKYQESEFAPGVNVGNLPIEVIKSEISFWKLTKVKKCKSVCNNPCTTLL